MVSATGKALGRGRVWKAVSPVGASFGSDLRPFQQRWQPRDIRRDAPRFIAREQVGRRPRYGELSRFERCAQGGDDGLADSRRREVCRLGVDQSWIDPGAAAGGEGGRAGVVAGAGVAGAARDGAGLLDVAFGAGSLLTGGISTGPSSLCGGLNRVNGGLPGGGG
jgi:hypothetical protein